MLFTLVTASATRAFQDICVTGALEGLKKI